MRRDPPVCVALGTLGGFGTALLLYAAIQVVLGMLWGLSCRFLRDDCTVQTFLNPAVLVPFALLSAAAALFGGWWVGRRIYRRTGKRGTKPTELRWNA